MQMPLNGCGLNHPCGDGYNKPPEYWLTLAYAGGCPGRFDVGCQIPMPFNFAVGAGAATEEKLIGPVQPNNPVALICAGVSSAVTITNIKGPDEKPIGMEGTGISGSGWLIAQFSFEALRSGTNLFPSNVGIVSKTNPLSITVQQEASASTFRGFAVGFAPGMKGVEQAVKWGHLNGREVGYMQNLAKWYEEGECPAALKSRLEKVVRMAGKLREAQAAA